MRWTNWLWSFGHAGQSLRTCRPARRFRPRLEALEDRHLLSSFLVVLGTDNGGAAGQKVTATTGDLRYCIEQADATHTATTDSIGFSSALTSTPHTITLNSANGPLVLSDSHPLTINGPTALTLNVSGGNQVEVFDIASGTVTIKNLAIIYGNAGSGNGGGISNQGTMTLSNCFLDHDSANSGNGGGIYNAGKATLSKCTLYLDSASQGGGMYSNIPGNTLNLTSCTFSNDTASLNGGGLYNAAGTATVSSCTFSADSALTGVLGGGGILNSGAITLSSCKFEGDTSHDGAAFYNAFNSPTNSTASLTNCTLSGNYGHDYVYDSGTITLAGCNVLSISAYSLYLADGTATVTNCSLSAILGGTSITLSDCPGAFYLEIDGGTATVSNCTGGISLNNQGTSTASVNNSTLLGVTNTGTVTLTSCTVSAIAGNVSAVGIDNSGTATLTNCTVANNSNVFGPVAAGILNTGAITLTNCTIANNSLSVSQFSSTLVTAYGGGIYNAGTATLINCTVADNTVTATNSGTGGAASYGGGIYNASGATLNLTNTIVASNNATTGPDVFNGGMIGTADHDLIGDGTNSGIANGGGNIVGGNGNPVIDPRLGPLQNNGGPTETMALLADSPAIGHADNTAAPAKDQRGLTRIDEAGETTDIGAFEL